MDGFSDWVAELPYDRALELAGVFFAALSGGLAGVRKSFDVFGVLVLSWAVGLGGGVIRDLLIGSTPPVGISNWQFVTTALAAGIVIFFFHPSVARMRRTVIILDAWALGFFVLLGTTKGLASGAGPLASVMVGVLTGIGGGMLRDILVGEVPLVLADRQLYAIPAFLGAGVTAGLWWAGWHTLWTQIAVVLLVSGIRLVSLRLGWVVPSAGPGWSGRWGARDQSSRERMGR
ncbi:trimeric intracellular cation channel family protein [Xylanimonas protaetiae]|uniref:Trimeric intracellular cation channel family protein n=1 Tax=Xylanimonas protaetiae TaxID=2509457 RepID=A0A4P6F734_9MICO|nr:trimeric intracellular cation channel family protein [Xylanimonas protaetiae]QAY71246.1 trimeric intracellular cation channel family protein [Xylanimonas protaetiae]